tara:strand:+ start:32621 stop:33571 length:951 start_codon:yes stop_codon:yes gene_type:complete
MDEILARLRALAYETPSSERQQALLSLLAPLFLRDDFQVALDYMQAHNLLTPLQTQQCLAQWEGIQEHKPWHNPVDNSEMIWIPAATFLQGDPAKPFQCAGFSMARHPVTNAQFAHFLEETGYQPSIYHPSKPYYLLHWGQQECPEDLLTHPIVYISWIDAVHYCAWAGLTLPTSDMWEHAARGTDGRIYSWGNRTPEGEDCTWANLQRVTCPVGSYPGTRTAYGCQDMIGNVMEFCLGYEPSTQGLAVEFPLRDIPAPKDPGRDYFRKRVPVRGGAVFGQRKEMAVFAERSMSKIRRDHQTSFRPAFVPYAITDK